MAASEKSGRKPRSWAAGDTEVPHPPSETGNLPLSIATFGSLRSLRFAIRKEETQKILSQPPKRPAIPSRASPQSEQFKVSW